jgi:hypothetical protein
MVGYNSRNKDTMDVVYICPMCHFILRDPVQLYCGHRCCQSCADREKRYIYFFSDLSFNYLLSIAYSLNVCNVTSRR